jgi:hypothetical protein
MQRYSVPDDGIRVEDDPGKNMAILADSAIIPDGAGGLYDASPTDGHAVPDDGIGPYVSTRIDGAVDADDGRGMDTGSKGTRRVKGLHDESERQVRIRTGYQHLPGETLAVRDQQCPRRTSARGLPVFGIRKKRNVPLRRKIKRGDPCDFHVGVAHYAQTKKSRNGGNFHGIQVPG